MSVYIAIVNCDTPLYRQRLVEQFDGSSFNDGDDFAVVTQPFFRGLTLPRVSQCISHLPDMMCSPCCVCRKRMEM